MEKNNHNAWDKSQCKGTWLHRYSISGEWEDCIRETCQICKKSVYFPVRNGRPNNLEYIHTHMRQVLLPQHALYEHEYPKE